MSAKYERSDEEAAQPVGGSRNESTAVNVLGKCGATVFALLIVIGAVGVPVVMMVIGAKTIDECRVEPLLPYYLIIAGVTFIILLPISFICGLWIVSTKKDGSINSCLTCYNGLFFGCLSVFSIVWFICGNVWVYRIDEVDFVHKDSKIYCNELTYRFTFWVIIATYICSVLSCCLSACVKRRSSTVYQGLK